MTVHAGHPEGHEGYVLLLYRPEQPAHSVYYPFAVFSPEWQAIQHGLSRNAPNQPELPALQLMKGGA